MITSNYSKNLSNNGPSEKQTTSVQRTAHLPPIDLTIELIYISNPQEADTSQLQITDTDQSPTSFPTIVAVAQGGVGTRPFWFDERIHCKLTNITH